MARVSRESLAIGVIVISALLVRIWGVDYDLPYIYHPDEPSYIVISQNIFKTGDLNPHFFNYPSLFFYVNALAYIPYFLIETLMGSLQARGDILPPTSLAMGVTHAQTPATVLLGRLVTICFGTGTVVLTYFAGKQISGRAAVGVLASLMVAVSPTNVWHSRVMKPDSFVTFFSLASFLASTLVYQQGKTRHYVVAGLCAGLTASSKYNGGLITFSLIIAHFLRCGRTSFKEPKLYLALFLCVAGFIATTPYAVLDSSEFLAGLRSEARHYATGHAGMEGDSLAWYLDYMWDTGGGLYLLALAGLVYGFRRRPKETGLLACFPLVYFALVSGFLVRNDRTFLPMIAFLCVAVAWCLVDVFGKCNALKAVSLRRLMLAVPAVLTIAALATPMSRTIADGRGLAAVDSRETARIWIDGNLPRGSRIAIESYSPFVDPSRYSVMGFRRMIDNDANWYRREGFEYLVFSELLYGRFYEKSERYRSAAERYERLFSEFSLVTVFTEGGHDIRVYRVKRGRLSPDPSSPRTR